MNDRVLVLVQAIQKDLEDIALLYTRLDQHPSDVMPLRPAIIDDAAYEALDELRRFRHLFRHAYGVQLDPLRLNIVVIKAMRLKAIYRPQLEQFLDFLHTFS
ncbi:MAG: hypothetical protein JW892_04815 [Anaerolineae bacterium]|nr:hypothetical protein [Anaerolineae bacterium]